MLDHSGDRDVKVHQNHSFVTTQLKQELSYNYDLVNIDRYLIDILMYDTIRR